MIKIQKLNVIYSIPEEDLSFWESKGFKKVENIKINKRPITKIEPNKKEEEIVQEVSEKTEKVNLWTLKTDELINMAINKKINLTGEESRKELINKLK